MRYNMDTIIPSEVERLTVKYRKGVYGYVDSLSKQKLSKKQKEGLNIALKVFLYNCIVCSASKRKSFAISLDKNTYAKPAIRNGATLRTKLSYIYTKKVIEYFEYKELVTLDKGYVADWGAYKKGNKWFFDPECVPSFVTLKRIFSNRCLDIEVSKETLLQINNLILRDSDKNDKAFRKTKDRKGELDMLNEYNVRALETIVTKNDNTDTYLVQLRKIYNQDFTHGGRLYDLVIQGMPKQERKKLLIDGEKVVLLDYKSFETSLAYTLCDSELNGDPYHIDFVEYHPKIIRDVCKLIMTRIFNVDNYKTLVYLVNEHIRENYDLAKLVKDRKIPEKRIPVGLFVDILIDKHDAIQDYFFNKGEHNLQYVGSQIMDYVIEKVMQNHKQTVIPVFDEVVCGVSIKDNVKQYMKDAYDKVLDCSVNCKVEEE